METEKHNTNLQSMLKKWTAEFYIILLYTIHYNNDIYTDVQCSSITLTDQYILQTKNYVNTDNNNYREL